MQIKSDKTIGNKQTGQSEKGSGSKALTPDSGKHLTLTTAISRSKNSGQDLQFDMNWTDQSNTPETDPGIMLLSNARDILSKQPEDYV